MDFYNCPYVAVIPFRNGNEYDEDYKCEATDKRCQGCACKLKSDECKQLILNQKLEFMKKCEKCEYVCDTPLGSYCTLTNEPLETTICHYNDSTDYDADEVIMFSRD